MKKELIGVGIIRRKGLLYVPNEALERAGIPKEKIHKASVKVAIYHVEFDDVQGILLRPIEVIEDEG
jgi:hypothetical protein